MSILAIGDLHIQPDNLADINVFLKQLEKYLQSTKVDLIINLGDTLHTHEIVHTACLNKMLEYIQLCEKYALTYVLIGNHDYSSNMAYLNDNHPFVGWKKSHHIVDRVISLNIQGKKIVLSPYVPDGRFQEALNTLVEGWKDSVCIFGHQLLNGAKMGAIVAKDVEEWKPEYPLLVSGHIHDKQQPQPNLYYTGSSIQVAFAEREDHTISLINLSTLKYEEINIYPPTKKTVYLDISNVNEMKIPTVENTKFKVSISGDAEEFKTFKKSDKYKSLIKEGVKVVFKQKRNVPTNLPTTNLKSFPDILFSLVADVPEMVEMYRQIFNHETEIVFS